jgi:hypothetical protein
MQVWQPASLVSLAVLAGLTYPQDSLTAWAAQACAKNVAMPVQTNICSIGVLITPPQTISHCHCEIAASCLMCAASMMSTCTALWQHSATGQQFPAALFIFVAALGLAPSTWRRLTKQQTVLL